MGTFLKFLGTRVLNPEAQRRNDAEMNSRIYFFAPTKHRLRAKLPDRSKISVSITGRDIHGNNNSDFWHRRGKPIQAVLSCGSETRVVVHVSSDKDSFTDNIAKNAVSSVTKNNDIGFLGINSYSDYIPDDTCLFSSFNDGCGMIDLGCYGPFSKAGKYFVSTDFLVLCICFLQYFSNCLENVIRRS